MMVYVIDARVPPAPPAASLREALVRHQDDLEQGWRRVISVFAGHEDAKLLMVQPAETWADVVLRMIGEVRTPWTIYMLRIMAHGYSGYIEMGTGIDYNEARHFQSLAHYMTPAHLNGRGVEIHGCGVAQGAVGTRLIQRIANRVGMPVVASAERQGADNLFRFERSTFRAEPRRSRGTSTR